MKTANYKKWIYSGAAIFLGSNVAGILGVLWGIRSSFKALETNESASIEAVESGIRMAMFFNVFFIITGIAGLVILIVGCVKAYRYSKSKNNGSEP